VEAAAGRAGVRDQAARSELSHRNHQHQRTHRSEKLARIYDDEILPIWAQRFGRLMLRGLSIPPKATILDASCMTGYPALEIARRMDEQSRLVAIDSSATFLDIARHKAAELAGRRVFFRTERAEPRLPFAAEVFDIVYANLGLQDNPSPTRTLRDFTRVAKPGGRVLATLPLAGSWQEFTDLYREVLVKHDKGEILARLDQWLATLPEAATVESWLAAAGLDDARVEIEEFTLLFRSAREFFFAPVVEYGPLSDWKAIAGQGQELQDVFWHIKETIDAYFGGRAFQVTIRAGCMSGVRGEHAAAILAAAEDPDALVTGDVELVAYEDGDEDGDGDRGNEGEEPAVVDILAPGVASELDAFRDPDGSTKS
jgi:ubiquinone/menaquinone biosynthesis C-methylase UbiE